MNQVTDQKARYSSKLLSDYDFLEAQKKAKLAIKYKSYLAWHEAMESLKVAYALH